MNIAGLIPRFGVAGLLAAGVTFGLFLLMHTLIAIGRTDVPPPPSLRLGDFLMPPEQIETHDAAEEVERPDTPPPPPEFAPPDPAADANIVNIPIRAPAPKVNIGAGGSFIGAGEYIPLFKVVPQYPRRALERGIEGFVLVEFTITETGSVEDVVVIQAMPPGMFNGAAVRAARRLKYKPRVVDGVPERVTGVPHNFRFELEE